MIIRVLWTVIGLNVAALFITIIYFLVETSGRSFREQELGWSIILALVCVVIIFLAAIPLYISQSTFSICFSAFFAFLPLAIWLYNVGADKLPSLKRKETIAEVYYKDKSQRAIAEAIVQGDTVLLKELIRGQDLNIQGNRVWDWDGINYLQFAIRIRNNGNLNIDKEANLAVIEMLVAEGSATTRALAEGIGNLPLETLSMMLEAGADPDTHGFAYADPLLFSAIGASKREVDVAILLVQKGASVDVVNEYKLTPLMYAANNSRASSHWFETWRFVRFLLEEQHVDYTYINPDGASFSSIIDSIRIMAETEKVAMPSDFIAVVDWLERDQKTR